MGYKQMTTTKTKPTKTKQQPTDTKPVEQQPIVTELNATNLIAKMKHLPLIQTKHLVQLMGFNDGGKFIRRHLRKSFVDSHLWGDSWVWKTTDKQLFEIVEYFIEMGVYNETKRIVTSSLTNVININEITIK